MRKISGTRKEYLKNGKLFENKSNISRIRNTSTKTISEIRNILRIKEIYSMGIERENLKNFF